MTTNGLQMDGIIDNNLKIRFVGLHESILQKREISNF